MAKQYVVKMLEILEDHETRLVNEYGIIDCPLSVTKKSGMTKVVDVDLVSNTLGPEATTLAGYLYRVRRHLSIQDSLKMANLFASYTFKQPTFS